MENEKRRLNMIDWKAVLLENYRDLLLNEDEVMIIFMCDFCLRGGERLVTPDILSLKMTLDYKTIDKIYASLIKKGFITIEEDENKKQRTSLEKLKTILYDAFLTASKKAQEAARPHSVQSDLISLFENRFGRPLTYIEIETIQSWLDEGNDIDKISQALDEATSKRVRNVRYIDKILLERRQTEEFNKEGATTISDKWRNDIAETQSVIGLDWVNKKDDDK